MITSQAASWNCGVCKLVNKGSSSVCMGCVTPRPVRALPTTGLIQRASSGIKSSSSSASSSSSSSSSSVPKSPLTTSHDLTAQASKKMLGNETFTAIAKFYDFLIRELTTYCRLLDQQQQTSNTNSKSKSVLIDILNDVSKEIIESCHIIMKFIHDIRSSSSSASPPPSSSSSSSSGSAAGDYQKLEQLIKHKFGPKFKHDIEAKSDQFPIALGIFMLIQDLAASSSSSSSSSKKPSSSSSSSSSASSASARFEAAVEGKVHTLLEHGFSSLTLEGKKQVRMMIHDHTYTTMAKWVYYRTMGLDYLSENRERLIVLTLGFVEKTDPFSWLARGEEKCQSIDSYNKKGDLDFNKFGLHYGKGAVENFCVDVVNHFVPSVAVPDQTGVADTYLPGFSKIKYQIMGLVIKELRILHGDFEISPTEGTYVRRYFSPLNESREMKIPEGYTIQVRDIHAAIPGLEYKIFKPAGMFGETELLYARSSLRLSGGSIVIKVRLQDFKRVSEMKKYIRLKLVQAVVQVLKFEVISTEVIHSNMNGVFSLVAKASNQLLSYFVGILGTLLRPVVESFLNSMLTSEISRVLDLDVLQQTPSPVVWRLDENPRDDDEEEDEEGVRIDSYDRAGSGPPSRKNSNSNSNSNKRDRDSNVWICAACTLENKITAQRCAVCDHARS